MEQKEVELAKEQDTPEAEIETPAATLADPAGEEAGEEEAQPEEESQALLPLASGVGRRVKRRKSTAIAKTGPDAAGELDDRDHLAEVRLASWRKPSETTAGLGRGGLAAVALLVIFIPAFIFMLFLLYDATTRIDAVRENLATFNNTTPNDTSNLTSEQALVQLLNRPNVRMYQLKAENLSPTGRVVFYSTGKDAAFTYGNLDPLDKGQVYSFWLSTRTAGSPDATFVKLGTIPDDRSLGRALVVKPGALPANFNLANYAEVSVTIEQADRSGDKPAGPRAFAIDLTQPK